MQNLYEIKILLSKLKELRRRVSRELLYAPKGNLMIQKDRGYYAFRQDLTENGKRIQKGIGKDPDLIDRLAHKAFNVELKRRLDVNIGLIERALTGSLSLESRDIIEALPESFSLLDQESVISGHRNDDISWPDPRREGVYPVEYPLEIDPSERFNWAKRPYLENTLFLEYKIHRTPRGILCRSKSEVSILGVYDSFVLPYHYDEQLFIGHHRISPDIVGCRADGQLIFHEHIGVDSDEYRRRYDQKDRIYRAAGIVQGKNLIYTFDREDGSINLELISAMIRDMYDL